MKILKGIYLGLSLSGLAQAQTGFAVSSPDLHPGGEIGAPQVLNGFGCSGGNHSPAVQWSKAPARTRSYAVTLYDPDAPTGSGLWHWLVYDIPEGVRGLVTGAADAPHPQLPAGARQGVNDFGTSGYSGPCPPQGDRPHRYVLTVYALDVAVLDLPANASNALLRFTLHGHTLATATLTSRYGR